MQEKPMIQIDVKRILEQLSELLQGEVRSDVLIYHIVQAAGKPVTAREVAYVYAASRGEFAPMEPYKWVQNILLALYLRGKLRREKRGQSHYYSLAETPAPVEE